MSLQITQGLTYDDVLLTPQKTSISLKDVDLSTHVSKNIHVALPILSAPIPEVTEGDQAIALALEGGLGVLHNDHEPEEQAAIIAKIKRHESGFLSEPIAVQSDALMNEVAEIREDEDCEAVPVLKGKKFIGLITKRDYSLPDDLNKPVKEIMVALEDLIVAEEGVNLEHANTIIREHKLDVLPIVSKKDELVSIVTRKDIELNEEFTLATKDKGKSLVVAGAIGVGEQELERAAMLVEAGADALFVYAEHGHSTKLLNAVRTLSKEKTFRGADIIAGSVETYDGAKDLISAGADAICTGGATTKLSKARQTTGVGIPPLTAIAEVARAATVARVPVIAWGEMQSSGDIVKALAAGANGVMLDDLLSTANSSLEKALEKISSGIQFGLHRAGADSIETLQKRAVFVQASHKK